MSDNYGNNYGAVLFDMDGVLIDSMPFHVRAYNDVLSKYGISVSELEVAGRSTQETLTSLLGNQLSIHEIADLAKGKSMRSLQLMEAVGDQILIENAIDILHKIYGQKKMALCTSASGQSVSNIINTVLPKYLFDQIVHSGMVNLSKPDPEIYVLATELLSLTPSSCLVVEDSISGVQSGIAAGCDVVYISNSDDFHSQIPKDVVKLESLSELPTFLGLV